VRERGKTLRKGYVERKTHKEKEKKQRGRREKLKRRISQDIYKLSFSSFCHWIGCCMLFYNDIPNYNVL